MQEAEESQVEGGLECAPGFGTIPDDLEGVVMRCLEKTPDARYRDAAELMSALAACRFSRRAL